VLAAEKRVAKRKEKCETELDPEGYIQAASCALDTQPPVASISQETLQPLLQALFN